MRRSVLARSGCFHFSPALKRELSLRRKTFPLLGYFCQSFVNRSEEHTSELQSQSNLVCRLLLEKKKKKIKHTLYNYHVSTDCMLDKYNRTQVTEKATIKPTTQSTIYDI